MQAKKGQLLLGEEANMTNPNNNSINNEKEDVDVRKTLKLSFQGVQDNKARFVFMLLGAIIVLSLYPITIFLYNIYEQNAIESATNF